MDATPSAQRMKLRESETGSSRSRLTIHVPRVAARNSRLLDGDLPDKRSRGLPRARALSRKAETQTHMRLHRTITTTALVTAENVRRTRMEHWFPGPQKTYWSGVLHLRRDNFLHTVYHVDDHDRQRQE